MATVKKEATTKEEVAQIEPAAPSYEELYEGAKAKIEYLNTMISSLTAEKEELHRQLVTLDEKYGRLFNLLANNIDFYLTGSYLSRDSK